jgi:tetrahydromethanopterin S-methyltransferase subunit B
MKILKYFSALLVLGLVLNCSKISEKVEEKVNQKVNEKIDENLKKIDSTLDKNKIDSLMKSLDTLKSQADSLLNEENTRKTRKTK